MAYDKKKLEDIVDGWNDWLKYENKFNDKNGPGPADSELRHKVGKKWNKINPTAFPQPGFLIGKPDDKFYEAIRNGKGLSEESVVKYTEENLHYILNETSKNLGGLYQIAMSFPLHKTGNAKNDEIRGLISEVMGMNSMYAQEDKPQQTEEMQQYIYSKIKDNPYILNFVAYMMANSPEDTRAIFTNYHEQKAREIQEKFSEDYDKRKLSKGKLLGFIKDTIEYTKSEEAKETDKDKKDKLRGEMEEIYKILAQAAYRVVKG